MDTSASLESEPTVDVHCHSIPAGLVRSVRNDEFGDIEINRDIAVGDVGQTFGFPAMAPSPPAPAGLLDPDLRARWCHREAIDRQLVGPWTDLLGYSLSKSAAARWSRRYNECLVAECDGTPNTALATVPLSYPDLAVAELRHARELGCVGTMIGTDIPDLHLGSAELAPFWEASVEHSMPVVVHPTFMSMPPELRQSGLKNAVARAGASALALAQLVYSGALVRHEGLEVVACHGGGGFVPLIPRVVRNAEIGWAGADTEMVRESISRLNVDSVVLDPNQVTDLVRTLGPEQVLLGSDYPFPWEPAPVRTVERCLAPASAKLLIRSGNATRIFCHLCS